MKANETKFVVVDSTPHACHLVTGMLFELSARKVVYFTDIDQTWVEILRGPVGCLIIEHALNKQDGFDLIRRIRSHKYERLRQIPIILLTATGEKKAITTGRDLGVDEIIVKPFAANVLKMRLDAISNNRRDFVRKEGIYSGPDRRRRTIEDFPGNEKRSDDETSVEEAES